jgi:hypothetical protein
MTPHELQRTAELDRQWTEVTDWLRDQEPAEWRAWIDCCIAGAPLNPVQIESLKKLASVALAEGISRVMSAEA